MVPLLGSSNCSTSAAQMWAVLRRHARDEINNLRLQELCRDNDRVTSLVCVHSTTASISNSILMVDLSRQRMTLETLNHLLRLGTARGLPKFIRQLSWGPNDPDNPLIPARSQQNQKMPNADTKNENNRDERIRSHHPVCGIPSCHLSLRVPSNQDYEMLGPDGTNVLTSIHRDWDRIRRISESLRRGKLPGVTGGMIKDVVVVGQGPAVMALRFVYLALCKDEAATIGRRAGINARNNKKTGGQGQRRIKFLTTVDPVRAAAVVADSDPSSTLVITIAMMGEEETEMAMLARKTLQTWLNANLGGPGRKQDLILSKHCMLVTSNDVLASQQKAETVFLIPDHSRCEPFATFTAASLLPLSIVFGWPVVEAFVAGAHDMDQHFVETNPRHNLPVLLALTDIWNDCLLSPSNKNDPVLNSVGRIVTPYTEAFAAYPAFIAAIEAQICGVKRDTDGMATYERKSLPSSSFYNSWVSPSTFSTIVIDGGLHGIHDRSLYQSSKIIPSELVMTLDPQLNTNGSLAGGGGTQEIHHAQDALMCSLFAHADEFAFGSVGKIASSGNKNGRSFPDDETPVGIGSSKEPNSSPDEEQLMERQSFTGNRPSTLLLCGRVDAFTCGQLVAMAEHRSCVKAWIWEIDPFSRNSVVGTSSRLGRTKILMESLERMMCDGYSDEEDDGDETEGINFSTKTILRHYANMVMSQR